jgi:hypothetical protein
MESKQLAKLVGCRRLTEADEARSILHVTVGIPGQWEPTDEELEAVTAIFKDALDDPKGAVVATRTGIESHVLPMSGKPTLEVIRQQVPDNSETTGTTLSIYMPLKEMELLAKRIGVSCAELKQAGIRDAYGNRLRCVQSIDLATGEAVLNITCLDASKNVTYTPAMKALDDHTIEPITARANLSGCWLTFSTPAEGAIGRKDKRIPIESLLNNTESMDTDKVGNNAK